MSTKKIFDIYPLGKKPKKTNKDQEIEPKSKIKSVKALKKESKKSGETRKINFLGNFVFIKKLFFKKIIFILFPILFAILIIFLHLSARADIEIWPKIEAISFEKEISIDAQVLNVDFDKKIVPGQFFAREKQDSKTFSCSGILEKNTKAKGIIKVFNDYHLSQTLVVNTRFISADGNLFYSKDSLNVASGQSKEVEVIAAEAGNEYNIKPTTFSIPGLLGSARYTAVYGKSSESMQGGAIANVSQVSQKDIDNAQESLFNELFSILKQDIQNTADPDFLILDQAIKSEILEKSFSKELEQEAKEFDLNMKVLVKGLAFKKDDINNFAKQWALEQAPENKKLKLNDLKIEYSIKDIDFEKGTISLKINVSADIFTDIDEQSLKYALSGKSLEESRILLSSDQEITKTRLRISPFWIKNIPENAEKIKIKLNLDLD